MSTGAVTQDRVRLVPMPIDNDRHLRLVCVQMALDAKEGSIHTVFDVLAVAREYEAYIRGDGGPVRGPS